MVYFIDRKGVEREWKISWWLPLIKQVCAKPMLKYNVKKGNDTLFSVFWSYNNIKIILGHQIQLKTWTLYIYGLLYLTLEMNY